MYNGVAVRRFTWFDGNNIRDWIFDTAGTKLCFTGHPPKTKTGNASKYKKYSANGTVVDSTQNMTAKHVETSLFTKPRCCKNLIVLSVKWYVWECGQMMVVAWIDVGLLQEAGVTTDPCIDLCSTSHQSDWLASIQKIGREKRTKWFCNVEAKKVFPQPKLWDWPASPN